MSSSIRLPEILDLARRDGKVTVDGLAQHFAVSAQTVRKDLADLGDAGHLVRVHGGAVLPSATRNIAHEERSALNSDAKKAIARTCAAAIPDGASLFLAIGTTAEAVARELLHHKGLFIITNNLAAASILSANHQAEIILTGGRLRRADNGLVGAQALETVQQFHPDYAILGCSALTEDGQMLDFDLDEIAVSRAILDNARFSMLVSDHSKFQRAAPVRIEHLSRLSAVFTDAPLPAPAAARCQQSKTEVHLCS